MSDDEKRSENVMVHSVPGNLPSIYGYIVDEWPSGSQQGGKTPGQGISGTGRGFAGRFKLDG